MNRKFKLQLFAEAVAGKKIIYLYRILSAAATSAGTALAFTTENSLSIDKDSDSTATKDGPIRTPGQAEIEIESTSIFKKGDTLPETLRQAMMDDSLIEIWRANLEAPASGGQNQFAGTYYQGYLTSFEETSNAEDYVEYSLTFGINGTGANGNVTVTAEQQEVASYVFKDTPQMGA